MKPVLPILFLLILPMPVLAGISVEADKPLYNLGDFIVVSYTVSTDSDFSGLTRLSLVCSNSSMDFYALPTSLFAGQSQSVTIPGLAVVHAMGGRCYIDANVSSFGGLVEYSSVSSAFNVTGSLPVTVRAENETFLPGDEIAILGHVAKSHASRASVALSFLDRAYSGPVLNNSFSYSIRLPADVKSGKHSLRFLVNDSYGNSGAASFDFVVEAVPKRLLLSLSNSTAIPGDVVRVSVSLIDQAGDAMGRQVSISLVGSAGGVALRGSDISPAVFRLELPSSLPPGTYAAEASSSGLAATAMLFVEAVEDISISFDGRTLSVVNTGNVDYSKKLAVNLTGVNNQFVLLQGLELSPGQSTVIDLYKEVPEDDYEISFPGVSGNPSFESHLQDERSSVRKASDFVGITSKVVQQTGTPGIQTVLSPLIIVVVIGMMIFVFSRKRARFFVASSRQEAESLKLRLDEQRRKKLEAESPVVNQGGLSRDDESVRNWMRNLRKDKPL